MNADGNGLTVINTPESGEHAPAWSPDGAKIAFEAHTGGRAGVYTMNLDGSGVVNVNNTPAADELNPDWQPLPVDQEIARHVRPRGATPWRVPLVPAYGSAGLPTATARTARRLRSSPATRRCPAPPISRSEWATGAPRSRGPWASSASTCGRALPGAPNDADVFIRFSITNVMRAADLSEYTGELRTGADRPANRRRPRSEHRRARRRPALHIHGPPVRVPVPCAPTPGSSLDASTCALSQA